MRAIFMLALFIFFIGASIAAEDSDELNKTAESYASFEEIDRLSTMNGQINNVAGGDMVTADGPYFTAYLLFRGWPAVMCEPGGNPNIVGKCFVDEDVNLENIIYSAGVKDIDPDTSARATIYEKRVVFNNTSEIATLSLKIYVYWVRNVCDSSDSSSSLQFAESEGSDGEGSSASDCSSTNGTWERKLAQSIPAPQHIEYNKTHTIALTNYSWGLTANTSLTKEKFGFELIGHTSKCSLELFSNPFNKSDCSKNTTISASISQISPHFRVVWNESRQIYYGQMLNPPMPPYMERKSILLIYNYSSEQVEGILLPEGGMIDEAYVITPFGGKKVDINITTSLKKSDMSEVITVWLIIGVIVVSFKLMLGNARR